MGFGSSMSIFLMTLTTVTRSLYFVVLFPERLLERYLNSRDYESLCFSDESMFSSFLACLAFCILQT